MPRLAIKIRDERSRGCSFPLNSTVFCGLLLALPLCWYFFTLRRNVLLAPQSEIAACGLRDGDSMHRQRLSCVPQQ